MTQPVPHEIPLTPVPVLELAWFSPEVLAKTTESVDTVMPVPLLLLAPTFKTWASVPSDTPPPPNPFTLPFWTVTYDSDDPFIPIPAPLAPGPVMVSPIRLIDT